MQDHADDHAVVILAVKHHMRLKPEAAIAGTHVADVSTDTRKFASKSNVRSSPAR